MGSTKEERTYEVNLRINTGGSFYNTESLHHRQLGYKIDRSVSSSLEAKNLT